MAAIERIIIKLSGYPNLKYGRVGNRLEIGKPNQNGFPLTFVEGKMKWDCYSSDFGKSGPKGYIKTPFSNKISAPK